MVAAGLLLFGFFSLSLGRPTAHDPLHVHERRTDVPNGFKYVGKADPSAVLDLRIGLVQGNPSGLAAALYDVSSPGSANYRKHLSKAEVNALVAPKPESVQAVKGWLAKNNISAETVSPSGDWLSIQIPVAEANDMLYTQFNEYTHEKTGLTALRTMSYSVPASVKGHLDFIHPVTSFVDLRPVPAALQVLPRQQNRRKGKGGRTRSSTIPAPTGSTSAKAVKSSSAAASKSSSKTTSSQAQAEAATPDASCKTTITPECLQAIYNIPSAPASNNQSNLFVASFIGESADPADLQQFLGQFRSDIKQDAKKSADSLFAVQSVDGGTNNLVGATTEATLDIQYTVGLATDVDTTFVSVGRNNSDGIAGFLDVINALIAQDEVPFVLTTSFGFNEKDIPLGLANNMCNAYAQLGARGTTVLFGSGDGGVSGLQDSDCTTFQPTFPSTCPFVTSVGGTKSFGPEVAASFSSGGFSNIFSRPSYQDDAVAAYLKKLGNTNAGLFNTSGRAFPDIAAQAQNFQIVRGGEIVSVSGTSAASPTVGGLVALLNDAIFNDGGSALGFLNPLLYKLESGVLNDITQGSNPGCGTDGFTAAEGWDPITGLGTPDFVKLLEAVNKET
ncbi:subtilisin-like protein [Polyporus arcularius HHB13444]|uniref:tripeptidyl-peptidase II n=1 Tax=Polyporus arcularius HHB13444 TaxID=1314778 RepID=A0A5C3NZB6_9APHY|nr:subtilisin-like protein [Polyporus arcularius HHB13444]